MDIELFLKRYIDGDGQNLGVKPFERYASFDYCFNYFQEFKERGNTAQLASPENIQASCLQLGFYLASWGMLRGSTFIFNKSVKVYENVIREIANADGIIWNLDVDGYTPSNIKHLHRFSKKLISAFGIEHTPSDTLYTKIMLGVFGNVPAFDSYFKDGFGTSGFTEYALKKISDFYREHNEIIERFRIPTIDFLTSKPTNRFYTRAKMIDMVFFVKGGDDIAEKNRRKKRADIDKL